MTTPLITTVRVNAPVQPLSVIGDGQGSVPMKFLYEVGYSGGGTVRDLSGDVSDYTVPTAAMLDNQVVTSTVVMTTTDCIWIGYPIKFNKIRLTPHTKYPNTNTATLTAKYWDGDSWEALTITDGTAASSKCLATTGDITFTAPADWRQCSPRPELDLPGYWVQLLVSATLSTRTGIAECRVFEVFDPLKKFAHTIRYRDRIILASRPDARDLCHISRAFEEYGWVSSDSWGKRLGGQDEITSAAELYNQGWFFQAEDLFLLNGYNPSTYSFERAEIAGQVPVNPQVLLKAPLLEAQGLENKMGFYMLNRSGSWHFSGLQLNQISDSVDWWITNGYPRIDKDNLHLACGAYWPAKGWLIWAVPMILTGTSQTTNNRLIVFDLNLRAWLPPMTITAASLTVALGYSANAPGKLGTERLLAGDYAGNVNELFDPLIDDDLGVAIAAWFSTGWDGLGSPETEKRISYVRLYGRTEGANITLNIYVDGDDSAAAATRTFDEVAGLDDDQLFEVGFAPDNVQGLFFRSEVVTTDESAIYGIQYEWEPLRLHRGTGVS
jgi:hypothetical protein